MWCSWIAGWSSSWWTTSDVTVRIDPSKVPPLSWCSDYYWLSSCETRELTIKAVLAALGFSNAMVAVPFSWCCWIEAMLQNERSDVVTYNLDINSYLPQKLLWKGQWWEMNIYLTPSRTYVKKSCTCVSVVLGAIPDTYILSQSVLGKLIVVYDTDFDGIWRHGCCKWDCAQLPKGSLHCGTAINMTSSNLNQATLSVLRRLLPARINWRASIVWLINFKLLSWTAVQISRPFKAFGTRSYDILTLRHGTSRTCLTNIFSSITWGSGGRVPMDSLSFEMGFFYQEESM